MRALPTFILVAALSACSQSNTSDSSASKPGVAPPEAPRPVVLVGDERKPVVATAVKGLSEERDKMEGISFYSAKKTPYLQSRLDIYISLPDTSLPILRIMPVYYGDDWVFYDTIKVMADDQVVYEHIFPTNGVKHDNSSGSVWETGDYAAKEFDIDAIRKIAGAKSATIRFSGRENRRDHELTPQEFANLREILKVYDELTSKLQKSS